MVNLEQRVRDVQIRQQRQWLWQCVSAGLFAGGAIGTSAAVIRILTQGSISWMWVVAAVLTPVIAAASVAVTNTCSMQLAARTIDRQCGLKDRTQTALQFLATSADNNCLVKLTHTRALSIRAHPAPHDARIHAEPSSESARATRPH